MTIVNFILILCAVIAIVWGAYTLWISLTKTKKPTQQAPLLDNEVNEKDGIPIIPRHERPEYQKENSDNSAKSAEQTTPPTAETVKNHTSEQTDIDENHHNIPEHSENVENTTPKTDDGEQPITTTPPDPSKYFILKSDDESVSVQNSEDAFSALASATQTITPTVQTFDERKLKKDGFNETSPILDNHIQTQVDNDQNSPLNNAIQNLNISLFPNEQFSRISGRDLLNLFDKYGLKYGTMNMFHRYENKDGTGLLWFSVMMVTEDGIMPFDLNKLPNQYVKGLVMFVALPHPEASRGFDSMISISGLLAQDLQASLYDEAGDPLTKENTQQMRELAINFAK